MPSRAPTGSPSGMPKWATSGNAAPSSAATKPKAGSAQAYEANDQTQEAIETLEVALADLEQRLAVIREQGGRAVEPSWSGPAREMLSRLKPAG